MSMYGTRDATKNYQEEDASIMATWGFGLGRYNPCIYQHRGLDIRGLIRKDNIAATQGEEDSNWLKKKLEARFGIKSTKVWTRIRIAMEGRVLNCSIRMSRGWEYKADQGHGARP